MICKNDLLNQQLQDLHQFHLKIHSHWNHNILYFFHVKLEGLITLHLLQYKNQVIGLLSELHLHHHYHLK